MAFTCLTRPELTRHIRRQMSSHLCDDSGMTPAGTALYWLSDPRDLREVRYVGQTRAPRRRLLQHLNTSRLWLPDEKPWWVHSPKLRPLYEWIRQLHQDEFRLPVMVVFAWHESTIQARVAERARILECLEMRLPLLNFESDVLGRQIPLL